MGITSLCRYSHRASGQQTRLEWVGQDRPALSAHDARHFAGFDSIAQLDHEGTCQTVVLEKTKG